MLKIHLILRLAKVGNSLLIALFLVLSTCIAIAQAPNPDHPDDYPRLFPSPTGRNGYEDFVLAEDALRKSPGWIAFEKSADSGTAALSVKRTLLSDPDIKRALVHLRRGLGKQIQAPQESSTESARFSEMGGFRALGRLLCIEMYVRLSQGAVSDAIISLSGGLRFAYALQRGPVIAGLSAIVIDESCAKLFAEHLNQMSADDCDKLIRLAREWMRAPDPALRILATERDRASHQLESYRANPIGSLVDIYLTFSGGGRKRQDIADVVRTASSSEATARSLIDEAGSIASSRWESDSAEFSKPYWQRSTPRDAPNPEPQSCAEAIADELFGRGRLLRLAERFSRDQTLIQMLGVHAAICRYRWEFDKLPAALTDTRVGDLAIDPFTGKAFLYDRIDSVNYSLSSEGPYYRGSGQQRPSGMRIPIKLPDRSGD